MTYTDLRAKYPAFIFESLSTQFTGSQATLSFHYSLPPDHTFTHTVTLENLTPANASPDLLNSLAFHLGLAEMFSYWKLTCSPQIIVNCHKLSSDQNQFWTKLLLHGMGQYFYENQIDFTTPDFVSITTSPNLKPPSPLSSFSQPSSSILLPLGGGKDSIVTAEILKNTYALRPIVVYPATPATLRVSTKLGHPAPIIVKRTLDPIMLDLTKKGYLTGHVPYSAILAFIFHLVAQLENLPYIVVSNERSSDEGNVDYLGHTINHQYSKTLEFETDFNSYIHKLGSDVLYFSFIRPLYELQIGKLFSKFPSYFPEFRSCNRNQQQDSWCGRCAKCISIAMSLVPWIGPDVLAQFMGTNPLTDTANQLLISQMSDPAQVKPFECIVGTDEAQVCLEFISQGPTPRVTKFLSEWGKSPNAPAQFLDILKHAYANT